MPSICGIIYFENGHLITNELDLMADVLQKNPSDTMVSHKEPSAALLKINTEKQDPGSDFFRLPSGEIAFSNARLDNSQELARLLHIKPDKANRINDTEIIAKAYRKYGNNCIDMLKGSYAFAIYDPASQRFTLGRDQEGKNQLFYAYKRQKYLAFSTDIQALLCLPAVEEKLDGHQMVKFVLSLEKHTFPEDQNTLYRNIYSIQQGNCLEINRNSVWTKICTNPKDISGTDKCLNADFGFWPKNA